MIVNVSQVKSICKKHGRRLSREFLADLDAFVRTKLIQACEVKNGSKITLDSTVSAYIGMTTSGKSK